MYLCVSYLSRLLLGPLCLNVILRFYFIIDCLKSPVSDNTFCNIDEGDFNHDTQISCILNNVCYLIILIKLS